MFGVVLLTSAFVALANARIYERCELGRELMRLGISRDHVATWVCIAYHESRFDTAARNLHSGDHGLLQISELYWCGPGKACGVPCSAFRNDDISDDVKCALRIHEEHTRLQGDGFLAWVVYPQHCKHNSKKYLVDCGQSRHVKYFDRNDTVPRNVSYPNIDKSKPNYLAVSDLVKKSYEQTYHQNEAPLEWLNFKIDNIDKLKLPIMNKNRNYGFTTYPTATTVEPSIIGIKPPSPRRIESNQFRRRMMNLLSVPTKDDIRNEYVPRKFAETVTTSEAYTDIDLSQNFFLNNHGLRSSKNFPEVPYQTRELSRYNPNYIESFASTTPRTFINSLYVPTKVDSENVYVPIESVTAPSSFGPFVEIDLSHNLFINLHKLRNSKTSTETPYRTRGLSSYNPSYFRGYTTTTPRNNINLISISTKDKEENILVPIKSIINVPLPSEASTEIDLSHNPFINLHKLTSKIPLQTRGSSSYPTTYKSSFTSTTPRTTITTTTKKPTTSVTTVSTEKPNSPTTTSNSIVPRRGKSRYVPENNFNSNRTQPPSVSTSTPSPKISVSIVPKVFVINSKPKETKQGTEFRVKTIQVRNITDQGDKKKIVDVAKPPPLAGSSSDISQKIVNTPKPSSTNRTLGATRSPRLYYDKTHMQSTTSKPETTSQSTTTKRYFWTTHRPPTTRTNATSTTPAPASHSSPTEVTTVIRNVTESSPTTKSTWSIFDLYLNPTKATIKPFQFTPFPSSYKRSIFSGGTTALPPGFHKKP